MYVAGLGGVVPRKSHKLQTPVQFGEAQQGSSKRAGVAQLVRARHS